MSSVFIANIIFVIHLLLVVYMVVYPFTTNDSIFLFFHAAFLGFIILHWLMNSDTCALTEIEFWVRKKLTSNFSNKTRGDTFFGKLISPVYKVSTIEIYKLSILLMFFTIHKAVKNT